MYGRYQPFAEQRNEIRRIADAVGRKYSHRRLATRRDPPTVKAPVLLAGRIGIVPSFMSWGSRMAVRKRP